jgi:hypothetical protein
MKYLFKKGETSLIVPVFVQDSSSSVGGGLAGLTEASSITGGYMKRNGVGIALAVDENVTTEGTYQAPSAAGKVRIGTPANMVAGFYELHFHNDLFTTADYVTVSLGGASNMAPVLLEIQLTDMNLNDAVRGGMSSLPNAAADAAGGLPISAAGSLAMDLIAGLTPARMGALTDWINGGRLDLLLDLVLSTGSTGPWTTGGGAAAPTAVENRQEMDANSTKLAAAATEATLTAMKGAGFSETTDSLEAIRDRGDEAWATGGVGPGGIAYPYGVTTSGAVPLPDVRVYVYSDVALTTLIASGTTDNFGSITFMLDAGTYYFVSSKAGYSFVNPDVETVS